MNTENSNKEQRTENSSFVGQESKELNLPSDATVMDKPTEQTRIEKFFEYHDCEKFINEKYDIEIRNFGATRDCDFWYSVIDAVEPDRGSFFEMDDDWFEILIEDWEHEILEIFLLEFGVINNANKRSIRFWVDW